MKKQNEYTEILDFSIKIAKETGRILKEDFGKDRKFVVKKDGTMVTDSDLKSEMYIKRQIIDRYPDHNIFSEETENVNNNSEYTWFLDPLDGTHNFIYGFPLFGVSIGLAYRNEVVVGVVHLPVLEKTYYACKGCGAFIDGEKIKVSNRVEQTVITLDAMLSKDMERKLDIIRKLRTNVFKRLRLIGAASVSLSLVASGVFDGYVSEDIKPYDIAAGCLIVEEAGGVVSDFYGNMWSPYTKKIVASNKLIYEKIIKTLSSF